MEKSYETNPFETTKKIRISSDAKKRVGSGIATKWKNKTWKLIAYAWRFLTVFEAKYSINKLELLAVVWSVEHFKKLRLRNEIPNTIWSYSTTKRRKVKQRN